MGSPSARLAVLLLAAACTPPPPGPAPADPALACTADFDSVVAVVRRDYAGHADRTLGREAELAALTDSLRATLADGAPGSCARAIQRWTAFFRDPHLTVYREAPRAAPAPAPSPSASPPRPDRGRPSLRLAGDSTIVLRFPDFALAHAPAIDSLVERNQALLRATPYLILDVRGNGGGWSGSYRPLLPLLYTGPIHVPGMDVLSTPANISAMREGLDYPGLPDEVRDLIRGVLPRMEASPGEFVLLEPGREIRLDTVLPLPRAVALLIDRGCASSCEQLVSDSRQSRKVTVIGAEPTRGALDYGNVRTVRLPSGGRVLRVPIARWHGRPPGSAHQGLAPDLTISPGADAVELARRHLHESGVVAGEAAVPPSAER